MQIDGAEFDYVIVGAGSAGSVIAARLSERPDVRVLLIEAGGRDTSFWLKIPVGYGRTITDPKVNWKYMTAPNPALGGRQIYWPRGKTLGGSSSINGLIYIRGQAQDYDQWRQLGNEGWGYEDVLPYFRRSEDQENGEDRFHGVGGPLSITNIRERNPLCEALIASAEANGIPRNPDFNGTAQEGAGYYQGTIRNGKRCSASVAYLQPARRRKNLTVVTETFAERILFDGTRAKGVRLRQGDRVFDVFCGKELILSGGSINSPHLLLLSGVGPVVELQAQGINTLLDLPGVGENLQDHYGGQITWRCNQPITMNDVMLSKRKQLLAGLQWLALRNGPLSVPAGQAGLFTRVLPGSATPDVQFLFQTFSGGYYEDGLFKFSGFANFMCPVRPRSRGRLGLASADAAQPPMLAPNYFSDETDRRILVDALKLTRQIAATAPLADFISAEHLPGKDVRSDDEIESYFRENGGCVSHQVGTCKMGNDPMAVVDSSLRVRGLQGIRVADASIMPTLISGNTNAAAIMIGEKAAHMIAQGA